MSKIIANQVSPSHVSGRLATWHRVMEEAGLTYDDLQKPIDDPVLRQHLVRCWQKTAHAVSEKDAHGIMGTNCFGTSEAVKYLGVRPSSLPKIMFTKETLEECRETHILVAMFPLSILDIHSRINIGLFYNWVAYCNEPFAKYSGHASWQLIRKAPVPNSIKKTWLEQRNLLRDDEGISTAIAMVYTILGHYLATDERLFKNTFVRCYDTFSDKRRVQIGHFGQTGLIVSGVTDDSRFDDLGLASVQTNDK